MGIVIGFLVFGVVCVVLRGLVKVVAAKDAVCYFATGKEPSGDAFPFWFELLAWLCLAVVPAAMSGIGLAALYSCGVTILLIGYSALLIGIYLYIMFHLIMPKRYKEKMLLSKNSLLIPIDVLVGMVLLAIGGVVVYKLNWFPGWAERSALVFWCVMAEVIIFPFVFLDVYHAKVEVWKRSVIIVYVIRNILFALLGMLVLWLLTLATSPSISTYHYLMAQNVWQFFALVGAVFIGIVTIPTSPIWLVFVFVGWQTCLMVLFLGCCFYGIVLKLK